MTKRYPTSACSWGVPYLEFHGIEPVLQGEGTGIVKQSRNDDVGNRFPIQAHFRRDAGSKVGYPLMVIHHPRADQIESGGESVDYVEE